MPPKQVRSPEHINKNILPNESEQLTPEPKQHGRNRNRALADGRPKTYIKLGDNLPTVQMQHGSQLTQVALFVNMLLQDARSGLKL